jgi:hypothetical protein
LAVHLRPIPPRLLARTLAGRLSSAVVRRPPPQPASEPLRIEDMVLGRSCAVLLRTNDTVEDMDARALPPLPAGATSRSKRARGGGVRVV